MTAPAETRIEAQAPAKPSTRLHFRAIAMVAFTALLLVWIDLLGIPNDTVQVFLWLWVGTVAWNVEAPPRYHLNFLRDWWLPVAGLVVYFYSRGLTDELGLPVHFTMPIKFDEWLGGGVLPTTRLQEAWCGNPCLKTSEPGWHDLLFTTVYATHFLAGLTIAAVLWVRKRSEWVLWMRRFIAINFGALVVYILYPMAPPWMASEKGIIAEDLPRLTGRGWRHVGLDRIDLILNGVGNPVAAMPSLHAGITFLIAMYAIWRLRTAWRWVLVLYPLAMSTTLVYYAEHYVIDILAGALLAAMVMVGCAWWERWRLRRLAPPIGPIEPAGADLSPPTTSPTG